jgi:hypothetical protein
VLVLALIETTAPDYRAIETPGSTSLVGFLFACAAAGAGLCLRLALAFPWFATIAMREALRRRNRVAGRA